MEIPSKFQNCNRFFSESASEYEFEWRFTGIQSSWDRIQLTQISNQYFSIDLLTFHFESNMQKHGQVSTDWVTQRICGNIHRTFSAPLPSMPSNWFVWLQLKCDSKSVCNSMFHVCNSMTRHVVFTHQTQPSFFSQAKFADGWSANSFFVLWKLGGLSSITNSIRHMAVQWSIIQINRLNRSNLHFIMHSTHSHVNRVSSLRLPYAYGIRSIQSSVNCAIAFDSCSQQ